MTQILQTNDNCVNSKLNTWVRDLCIKHDYKIKRHYNADGNIVFTVNGRPFANFFFDRVNEFTQHTMINKKYLYFTVLKDNKGHRIKPRMVVFNTEIADKIEAEGIKFGLITDEYGNPTGVTIIERNGKQTSQIKDRSISKLVVGVPSIKRDGKLSWNNYTTDAYSKFLKKSKVDNTNYSELSEDELEFFIEYLNILLIKKQFENSGKLDNIKSKIK